MNKCVYGGQYGSEGKGSVAEYIIKQSNCSYDHVVVVGENSPNSGHTCSLGKTQNIPASSFFASTVLLGPDAAVDPIILDKDLHTIHAKTHRMPMVYIHEHAAFLDLDCREQEERAGVIKRISSTGSGSGAARTRKMMQRNSQYVVRNYPFQHPHIRVVTNSHWLSMLLDLQNNEDYLLLFECSQGALLDVNFGIYPFVTSRTTLPRVALERNGFDSREFELWGVYRTYPIRTGGPSGPTGGREITFRDIGVPDEIATVTKRVRRIFEFSRQDFWESLILTRPDVLVFTHMDYIKIDAQDDERTARWIKSVLPDPHPEVDIYSSSVAGQLYKNDSI